MVRAKAFVGSDILVRTLKRKIDSILKKRYCELYEQECLDPINERNEFMQESFFKSTLMNFLNVLILNDPVNIYSIQFIE